MCNVTLNGTAFVNVHQAEGGFRDSTDLDLNVLGQFGIVLEELLGCLFALTDSGFTHREPGAGSLDDIVLDRKVYQLTTLREALAVQALNPNFPERGRHLVLNNFEPGAVSIHYAHLLTQLVDEDDDAVGFAYRPSQLAQSLAHQPGQQTSMAVAMLPLVLARGVSAAAESTTTTSKALGRTRASQISRPCSPVSG